MYSGSRYCSPGDIVPASGAYKAVHPSHREDHLVIAMKGDVFPCCRHCGDRVRFVLQLVADFFGEDRDLAGAVRAVS